MNNVSEYKELLEQTYINLVRKTLSETGNSLMKGYKIVGWDERKKRAFSLYDPKIDVDVTPGSYIAFKGGVYLGNSREYVINYFSGGTDFEDLLLTYEFSENDILKGDTENPNTEIVVRKARLVDVEKLPQD